MAQVCPPMLKNVKEAIAATTKRMAAEKIAMVTNCDARPIRRMPRKTSRPAIARKITTIGMIPTPIPCHGGRRFR
jgi:hypothetical protein